MATSHALPVADRRVLLLLLDDQDRLMLCGGCCTGWAVPQTLLTVDADFKDGAARYLAKRFHISNPRFGSVHGVHETREPDCWEHGEDQRGRVGIIPGNVSIARPVENKRAENSPSRYLT
ncbi:hypothetical protein ABZX77_03215 [Streptomyces sp. NPDC004237]|uniref:hypothetical protein n=1 Tax=Streptomyces sp. NPDC004237 TaxID=3154455 RepID=UPI0033A7CD48